MSAIPFAALQFGGQEMTDFPVSYDKTRIAGSTKTTYILHSKGGCMPGQKNLFTTNSRSSPEFNNQVENNSVTRAFKREKYLEDKIPSGVKYPKSSKDYYTFQEYFPNDDESRELAIKASYRQVFGNFIPMESEIDSKGELICSM